MMRVTVVIQRELISTPVATDMAPLIVIIHVNRTLPDSPVNTYVLTSGVIVYRRNSLAGNDCSGYICHSGPRICPHGVTPFCAAKQYCTLIIVLPKSVFSLFYCFYYCGFLPSACFFNWNKPSCSSISTNFYVIFPFSSHNDILCFRVSRYPQLRRLQQKNLFALTLITLLSAPWRRIRLFPTRVWIMVI